MSPVAVLFHAINLKLSCFIDLEVHPLLGGVEPWKTDDSTNNAMSQWSLAICPIISVRSTEKFKKSRNCCINKNGMSSRRAIRGVQDRREEQCPNQN